MAERRVKATHPTVEIGQEWRRRGDGVLFRVVSHSEQFGDNYISEVGGHRGHSIYDWSLTDRYELVTERMSSVPEGEK